MGQQYRDRASQKRSCKIAEDDVPVNPYRVQEDVMVAEPISESVADNEIVADVGAVTETVATDVDVQEVLETDTDVTEGVESDLQNDDVRKDGFLPNRLNI